MTDYKINKVQNVSRMCAVCGINNTGGLQTRFYEIEHEGHPALAALPRVLDVHQSFPGRMHGGTISALLDELIGRAVQIEDEDTWGVTAELTVRFLKPAPLDKQLVAVGHIIRHNERLFEGEGRLLQVDTGEVLARATAKFLKLPPAVIFGTDAFHQDWFPDPRPAPRLLTF
ncbi:MAG: PaaI family thioesterase [Clostridiales bacterium]|jgi:acyl-coenzyme A thioesterase PaaI-like protein|nr:PaaI family thioesterase [Clostridiales bacterium]